MGRGPAPKPAGQRARRNVDPIRPTELRFVPGVQPELPADVEWPQVTRDWWAMWGRSAQASMFTDTDWSELMDTALLHRRHWMGDRLAAPELRLRVAKFGATPEDRARLRITFVQADAAEAKAPKVTPAQKTYKDLTVVAGAVEAA